MRKTVMFLFCFLFGLQVLLCCNSEMATDKVEYESGMYIVGVDIDPGSYIVTVDPDESSIKSGQRDFRIGIVSMYMTFEDMIQFNKEGVVPRTVIASVDEPQHITLIDGMALCITKDKVKTVWMEKIK